MARKKKAKIVSVKNLLADKSLSTNIAKDCHCCFFVNGKCDRAKSIVTEGLLKICHRSGWDCAGKRHVRFAHSSKSTGDWATALEKM